MSEVIGQKLKDEFSGCRMQVRQFGNSRTMTPQQKEQVAALFGAESASVSGSRRIFDGKHPLIQAVRAPINAAKKTWHHHTVDYDGKGTRLIRIGRIEQMNAMIESYQQALNEALSQLHAEWQSVVEDARTRLCDLFIEEDYAFDVRMSVGLLISYPAIEPDERLKQIAPEIYQAELQKIHQRFEEAAQEAEAMLADEFGKMVDTLLDRLTDDSDKPKVLQKRVVENLADFANRFKELSVSGDSDLSKLVDKISGMASGVNPKHLREPGQMRNMVREKLQQAKDELASIAVVKPSRVLDLD